MKRFTLHDLEMVSVTFGIERVAMLGGMLAVMLARRDEYSSHVHPEVTA